MRRNRGHKVSNGGDVASDISGRLRRDFGRSHTFMFANNHDFGKLFKVKQKRV